MNKDEPSFEVKLQDEAQRRGLGRDLRLLSAGQYRTVVLSVRPKREIVKAGFQAVTSRAITSVGLRTVSLEVAQQNQQTCEACPSGLFIRLRNNEPACNGCGCSNKYLRSKWRDRRWYCPKKHWDNRKVSGGGDGQERVAEGRTKR